MKGFKNVYPINYRKGEQLPKQHSNEVAKHNIESSDLDACRHRYTIHRSVRLILYHIMSHYYYLLSHSFHLRKICINKAYIPSGHQSGLKIGDVVAPGLDNWGCHGS